MPAYVSTDPNFGLDQSSPYVSTDPNFGLEQPTAVADTGDDYASMYGGPSGDELNQLAQSAVVPDFFQDPGKYLWRQTQEAKDVAEGVRSTLSGLVPQSFRSAAEFASPAVGGVEEVAKVADAIKKLYQGESIEQVHREENPEAYRYENFGQQPLRQQVQTVGGDVTQAIMAALGLKGLAHARAAEATAEKPPIPPEAPSPEAPPVQPPVADAIKNLPPEGQEPTLAERIAQPAVEPVPEPAVQAPPAPEAAPEAAPVTEPLAPVTPAEPATPAATQVSAPALDPVRRQALEAEKAAILGRNHPSIAIGQKLHPTTEARLAEIDQELNPTPEAPAPAAAPEAAPAIPPEDVRYAGGEQPALEVQPETAVPETPGGVGISQAKTEAELGPGSVEPGAGAEMGSGLAHGRNYINKGGDPRLPIRRANTSGMVGKNDVGIVHAELERLRAERSKAAAALEANPTDPVLQQNFSTADDAQRAWRKELQPVLTKASDALREAHATSMPEADPATYQGLADLMDEHFKGQREVTPEMRTAMAKAARGVKESRSIANGEMAKVEETLTRQMGGKKVMTTEELNARIRSKLESEFADCALGA